MLINARYLPNLSIFLTVSVCGNFVLYYLAEYSYISDVTSEAERTSRISIVDGTDYIFTMVKNIYNEVRRREG